MIIGILTFGYSIISVSAETKGFAYRAFRLNGDIRWKIYNSVAKKFEYWIDPSKNNIIKTSKIYTTCDDKYLYIHEFVAYYNNNLINNDNDGNITELIGKVDLDEYIYSFIKDRDNYYFR